MAEVVIPGSKSITARALFLSAAAQGPSRLRRPLRSDDTEAFAEGLRSLGYAIDEDGSSWTVHGSPAGPAVSRASLYTRDAGTAGRFLPALAAAGRGTFQFDASAQMRRRPIGPLVDALRALGARIRYDGPEGHLPITVDAEGLDGGEITIDSGVSSQFLTAILMAAPLAAKGVAITVTDLVSVPYVEMTAAMMRAFGVEVRRDGLRFEVPASSYQPQDLLIEPDASTSSYFFAAAALTGKTVTVPGLGHASTQGDLRFVEVLGRMGASVDTGADSTTVTGTGRLRGITVNMRDISDTMPTLAAIAPFADGPVRIEDVYNTRVKESDRLDACATNLRAMGIAVETGRDWIEIQPGDPRPALIDCRGDHRIAMSFSITGLRTAGLELDDPACVKKTFPEFHEVLAELRATWDLASV
jgi:3-phosphoshikimate 1-carboxyvinyltransferase